MAKKINKSKAAPEKSTMIKIAEKVGELAGKIVNQKDHLVEMAGDAIDSVKEKVKDITGKKTVVKKAAKKAVKKIEKKVIKPAAKKINKAAPAKKVAAAKKTVKAVVKKAAKKAIKKVAPKKK